MQRIAALFFLLIFISCGKDSIPQEGFTKISFTNNESEKSVQFNLVKGMMVYALNTNNGKALAKYAPNIGTFIANNQTLFLPNGDYKFFAIGYDSSTTSPAISSNFYVGEGNNGELVQLGGGEKKVNILLTSVDVQETTDAFASPNHRYNGTIKQLRVQLCAANAVTPGCTGQSTKSFRLVIGEYDNLFNGPIFNFQNSIKSCHNKTLPAAEALTTHFPMRIPFRFKLESFGVIDCVGAPVRSILFEHGIEATGNNPDRYINNSNATYVEIGIGV